LKDGVTYRDLKVALMVSDGALYSNIKALEAMDYVNSDKVKVENKTLERYRITEEGLRAFINVKRWLADLIKEAG
jgi:DNA-binding PadR family transcriptional regulator